MDDILEDWLDDLELWQEPFDRREDSTFADAKVHAGFLKPWWQLHGNSLSAVEAAQRVWSGYQLVITGHSLGGSLAALMAASLASSEPEQEPPTVYTFGQPRVGDPKFAEVYQMLLPDAKRVVHNRDIIPHYPFRVPTGVVRCAYSLDGSSFCNDPNHAHLNFVWRRSVVRVLSCACRGLVV